MVNVSAWRFLQLSCDGSASLGVRGELTQKELATIGIKNTRIFGCPTMFRGCQPEIRLRHADPDAIENSLVTEREPVSSFVRFIE